MNFACNSQTPHFSFEELEEIYAASPKHETDALKEAARKLFPGRDLVTYENLYISTGPGRAFKHNGDEYVNPKYILVSHPVMTGVMDDGTIYQF